MSAVNQSGLNSQSMNPATPPGGMHTRGRSFSRSFSVDLQARFPSAEKIIARVDVKATHLIKALTPIIQSIAEKEWMSAPRLISFVTSRPYGNFEDFRYDLSMKEFLTKLSDDVLKEHEQALKKIDEEGVVSPVGGSFTQKFPTEEEIKKGLNDKKPTEGQWESHIQTIASHFAKKLFRTEENWILNSQTMLKEKCKLELSQQTWIVDALKCVIQGINLNPNAVKEDVSPKVSSSVSTTSTALPISPSKVLPALPELPSVSSHTASTDLNNAKQSESASPKPSAAASVTSTTLPRTPPPLPKRASMTHRTPSSPAILNAHASLATLFNSNNKHG